MAETIAYKYRAFISYSHADTAWARWLHRGLESFRIDKDLVNRETAMGSIPKSLRPIFSDRDDFTAGQALSALLLSDDGNSFQGQITKDTHGKSRSWTGTHRP
jgi:hypothetical protein